MRVKICGLKTPETVAAACTAGAAYIGLNFYPKSPRSVSVDQAALLAQAIPAGVCKVALTVNAEDAFLDDLVARVPLDMLQLHGAETPDRVAEVKERYGLPVMRAVGIADESDLPKLTEFQRVADQILVDAKPPKSGGLPGGNGLSFDWRLVSGRRWAVPWMLAGGLTAQNVAEAIRRTGATQIDLASGVETAPGIKDEGLIKEFMAAAGNANAR